MLLVGGVFLAGNGGGESDTISKNVLFKLSHKIKSETVVVGLISWLERFDSCGAKKNFYRD